MHTEKITCDGCGHDLTTRTNSVDYRLVLAAQSKPGYGAGAYTDMMIYPPVDRSYHFCGLSCLDHWRSREHHKSKLWNDWNEKWKAEHGTKHDNGMGGFYWSYPCTPDDEREKRNADFEAQALAAFPMERPKRRRVG